MALNAAAAAAALCLSASPASAAKMIATFEGFVETGSDGTGLFGLGGTLDGAAFTAHYVYDTVLGTAETTPSHDRRYGGPGFGGGVSPILAADLTINGVTDTFSMGQDGAANVFLNPNDGWLQTFLYANFFFDDGVGGSTWNFMRLFVLDAPDPILLTTSYTGFNHDFEGDPLTTNEVLKSTYVGGQLVASYHADLTTSSVNLAPYREGPQGAVPEPATWGLLILGFGALGLALRRRGWAEALA